MISSTTEAKENMESEPLHRHVTFQKLPNSKYNVEGNSDKEGVHIMRRPWLHPLPEPTTLTLERISLPDGNPDFAGVIRNVLSKEECQHLIKCSEKVGYEQATVTTFGNQQVTMTNYRKSSRCIIDSDNIAGVIWERISNHIPQPSQISSLQLSAPPRNGGRNCHRRNIDASLQRKTPAESSHWRPYEINHRMRFLRYDEGEYFNRHGDGCYVDDSDESKRRQSWVTFQVYLNDGFEGGGTTFVARGENESKDVTVVPETGMVLLFSHPIEHQGDLVASGRKYAIRSDIMFERDGF
ncbi:hypothetical protein TrST_g6727 [Triparma strigata]|uniref:Prolyl 4-hydroxylase alpha subunit domain-containing protein n=1 Tax=Triparma strigata TaxID=1606541 RepID=A0A9W7F0L8_9STRA|nr:hypothetical protein TrST_g6727 [Triparma strigata]